MNLLKKLKNLFNESPKSDDIFHSHWNIIRLMLIMSGQWLNQNKKAYIFQVCSITLSSIVLRGQVNM